MCAHVWHVSVYICVFVHIRRVVDGMRPHCIIIRTLSFSFQYTCVCAYRSVCGVGFCVWCVAMNQFEARIWITLSIGNRIKLWAVIKRRVRINVPSQINLPEKKCPTMLTTPLPQTLLFLWGQTRQRQRSNFVYVSSLVSELYTEHLQQICFTGSFCTKTCRHADSEHKTSLFVKEI